jgi:hypothetical protein
MMYALQDMSKWYSFFEMVNMMSTRMNMLRTMIRYADMVQTDN